MPHHSSSLQRKFEVYQRRRREAGILYTDAPSLLDRLYLNDDTLRSLRVNVSLLTARPSAANARLVEAAVAEAKGLHGAVLAVAAAAREQVAAQQRAVEEAEAEAAAIEAASKHLPPPLPSPLPSVISAMLPEAFARYAPGVAYRLRDAAEQERRRQELEAEAARRKCMEEQDDPAALKDEAIALPPPPAQPIPEPLVLSEALLYHSHLLSLEVTPEALDVLGSGEISAFQVTADGLIVPTNRSSGANHTATSTNKNGGALILAAPVSSCGKTPEEIEEACAVAAVADRCETAAGQHGAAGTSLRLSSLLPSAPRPPRVFLWARLMQACYHLRLRSLLLADLHLTPEELAHTLELVAHLAGVEECGVPGHVSRIDMLGRPLHYGTLQRLDLRRTTIPPALAKRLGVILFDPRSSLVTVDLAECQIGDEGVRAMFAAFPPSSLQPQRDADEEEEDGDGDTGANHHHNSAPTQPPYQLRQLGLQWNGLSAEVEQLLLRCFPPVDFSILDHEEESLKQRRKKTAAGGQRDSWMLSNSQRSTTERNNSCSSSSTNPSEMDALRHTSPNLGGGSSGSRLAIADHELHSDTPPGLGGSGSGGIPDYNNGQTPPPHMVAGRDRGPSATVLYTDTTQVHGEGSSDSSNGPAQWQQAPSQQRGSRDGGAHAYGNLPPALGLHAARGRGRSSSSSSSSSSDCSNDAEGGGHKRVSMLHVESLSPLAHDKPVKMSATEHRKKLLKQQQQQPATGAAAAAACNAQQYMSQSGSTLALNSSTEYEVNSPRTNAIPCGATSLTQPLLGGGTGPGSGTEDLFPRNQSESSNGATLAEATDPTPTSNGGAEAAKQSAEAQNTMMMQQKKQAEQLLAPTTNSAAGGVAPLSDHLYHREEEEKDDSAGSSPTSFGLELIGTHGPGGRLKIPEVEQPHSDPGADSLHSNHMLMVRHGNSIDDHATPKNRSSMTSLKKVSSRLTGERGSLPHTPVSSVDTSATGNDDDDDRSRTQSHSINSYTNSTNQKSTCSSKNSARAKMLFSNQLYILLEGNYLSKVGAKRWNQYRLLYERYRRSTQEQGQPPLRSRARDTILPASKPVDLEALTREAVEASERAFATRRSLLKCMIVALDEQVRLSHEVECAAMRKKAQRRQRRAQRAAGKGEELFPFIQLNPLYSLRVVADMADNPLMGGSPYCCSHTNEKH